jgi:hypothetical protein
MDNITLMIEQDTHDLVLDDEGNLQIIGGAETVAQCVRLNLECFKGQWFLDINHGTDYDQIIDGSGDPETILSEAIYQETDVLFIDDISVLKDGRNISAVFSARLKNSTQIVLEVSV